MALVLLVLALAAFGALAWREAPLWQWALAALVWGMLTPIGWDSSGFGYHAGPLLFIALLPAVMLGLLAVQPVRRRVVITPAYDAVRSILPRVSRTEQEALDAGTVGWDAELFSGRPHWDKLLQISKPSLSAEEQAFLDGPVNTLCAMIDDWDTRHNRADLSPEVWQFLKDQRFFGMLISKEHGGLGFSAQAQSMVVSKVASRSVAAGITVMVPNSLGPGELLERYGTPEQKSRYLERLARGLDVPCFALTGPHAGSDAAAMRDVGVVTWGVFEGRKTLGVKLSWDKRYITLAPVATLLGLAFNLFDPENLLGKGENIGITLALIPASHAGVEIGRRHYPSRSAFMNGPTRGKNVFIPIHWLIGGPDYAGQGWRMLMECLSAGRAISLPAIGSTSIKQALRVSSAYARIRRQFGIPVGVMEGVAEPLSRLVKSAYTFEAARGLTAEMVDAGQRPSVISAILKYTSTEAMRDRVNDAMDIHGGRAVQDGPTNYLFSGYATLPVAITVEGANILTRTLITFAQGALRAHPFLYREIAAVQAADRQVGIAAFDKAFGGHAAFMLRNIVANLVNAASNAAFAPAPHNHPLAARYRAVSRYAQAFALVGDWTVAFLGGDLKRKQMLSGRLADILADLYLMSAVLKRYDDEGRIAEDLPLVDAILADHAFSIEQQFGALFANFPNRVLATLMKLVAFPFGRHARPSADYVNYRLVRAVLRPGVFRDRLTGGVFISQDPKDITGVLEDAMVKVTRAEEIEAKFFKAVKKHQVTRRLDRDAITDAIAAGVLTAEEAAMLRAADEATDRAIRVDDFLPDELAAKQLSRQAAE